MKSQTILTVKLKMKNLYVDTEIKGHHFYYLNALSGQIDRSICVVPSEIGDVNCRQIIVPKFSTFKEYKTWINSIFKIAQDENIDVIHFLYGDIFYRYFGFGLSKLKKYFKVVITFHHFRYGLLHNLSLKRIFSNINVGIVHTTHLLAMAEKFGIKNIKHIEYPKFSETKIIPTIDARNYLGISNDCPLLLALGGTREDKGLDILLEALKKVDKPFKLLIAGQPQTYDENFINKAIVSYKDRVYKILRYLTDSEICTIVSASDIVVLPYRKIFDGASGPLVEGVAYGKTIIGPNHGSLGQIIKDNHLGYTFESENVDDLARTINKALSEKFIYDEYAKKYQSALSVGSFIDSHKNLYDGLTKRQ